ncbi:hypothetical protein GALL_368500 [mine drainage metagenome]|jgi:hypothetical protein|uniref:Fe2OG dioxygenase domain-containing protein n=1 Tax=mine drainage metagenome TaxID=410659 RepID=A0A1J5QCP7_9ZZZZ
MNFAEKLDALYETLSPAEKANYKLLMGLAASGLSPSLGPQMPALQAQAFATVAQCLTAFQPYRDRMTANGIAWRGRPDFVTDALLESLQRESAQTRERAYAYDNHYVGAGAPIADKLALSAQLKALVREHAGEVLPTGIASYLYYDREGQGIPPHIDTDIFSLNVLLMLKHVGGGSRRSCLVVFPNPDYSERIDLEPGEIVIMFAGSITHAREPIQAGEQLAILTFGFHPLGE